MVLAGVRQAAEDNMLDKDPQLHKDHIDLPDIPIKRFSYFTAYCEDGWHSPDYTMDDKLEDLKNF